MRTIAYHGSAADAVKFSDVELAWTCPHRCGAAAHVEMGVRVGTYTRAYCGGLEVEARAGGKCSRWPVADLQDNGEVCGAVDVPACDGDVRLRLSNTGTPLALWMSSGDGANVVGTERKACVSVRCNGRTVKPRTEFAPKRLRIAGLVKTLDVHGGVRRYFELGNALVDQGHRFDLFYRSCREDRPWLPYRGGLRKYGTWSGEYDVVFTGAHECFDDLRAFPARKRVVKLVAKFYRDHYVRLWKHLGADALWVAVEAGVPGAYPEIQSVLIPGGTNTDFFSPAGVERERALRVGFYARRGRGRGVERVLSVASRFGRDVEFVGFDAPGYDSAVSSPSVRIESTPTQGGLRDVLRGCDVVMSAMYSAGWNNCIAEGMACGAMGIATPEGTRSLIVDGHTGYLCRQEAFEDEAEAAILYLLEHREHLLAMRSLATRWVQQFSWSIVATRFVVEVQRHEAT